jgi:hypothetical protein
MYTALGKTIIFLDVKYLTMKLCVFCLFKRQILNKYVPIRALSAHSAADFTNSPGRWQHVWLVAIALFLLRDGRKWEGNDCHTAWGNLKTLIYSLLYYKNYACSFSYFLPGATKSAPGLGNANLLLLLLPILLLLRTF